MELTARKLRFLKSAYKIAPGINDTFSYTKVGQSLGFADDEIFFIAHSLEVDFRYCIGIYSQTQIHSIDWSSVVIEFKPRPGDELPLARLTDLGRETARQAVEDDHIARTAKRKRIFWSFLKWSCAIVVSIWLAWLNGRIQHFQKVQDDGAAVIQPTTHQSR